MARIDREFADYCCELLSSVGPCSARRMFGGWGISTEGLTVALLVDLGGGATLWLKAAPGDDPRYTEAACQRFAYSAKGKTVHLSYYSAPPDAMESPALMAPWARLALQAALQARSQPAAHKGRQASRRRTPPKAA